MLCLHAGGEEVSYDALRQATTPPATATHVPVPHHRVVDTVRHMLSFYGHEVTEEHHGIAKEGDRYFGVLSLKSNYGDYCDQIGLRNSHDKKFPIGIAFGSRVFVCDNLAFSADQVIRRKHTINAKHELPSLISKLVEPLMEQRRKQYEAFERFKAKILSVSELDHAVLDLYRADVLNVQRIPEVLSQFEKPAHDWGGESVWRLFNAVTYSLNGRIAENPTTTTKLHSILEGVCTRVH